jgi:hypothetical protein
MSTLKIRQYSKLGDVYPGGTAPIAQEPGVDLANVTFTSSSVQSAAFDAGTRYLAIKADVAFCYAVGPNPTALATTIDYPASEWLFIGVSPGHKIAVIAAT